MKTTRCRNTAASVLTVGVVTALPVSHPDSAHRPVYLLTTLVNDCVTKYREIADN